MLAPYRVFLGYSKCVRITAPPRSLNSNTLWIPQILDSQSLLGSQYTKARPPRPFSGAAEKGASISPHHIPIHCSVWGQSDLTVTSQMTSYQSENCLIWLFSRWFSMLKYLCSLENYFLITRTGIIHPYYSACWRPYDTIWNSSLYNLFINVCPC